MRTRFLIVLAVGIALTLPAHAARFLFDADHGQSAGNADWVIDADLHNLSWTSAGTFTTASGNESNAQRIPTPPASGIAPGTNETYWSGAISAWAVDLVKRGHSVETLPAGTTLTYNTANAQDLTNYDVVVIDEPNVLFALAEKQALLSFVSNGGSLFMISDHSGSDRNSDGQDSVTIWNDFLTNNGLTNNPFGITFPNDNTSPSNKFYNTTPGDPLLAGPLGVATNIVYFSGNRFQIVNANNPTTTAEMWDGTIGQSNTFCMLARLQYGKGRVVVTGDSSSFDDGTGDPNDTSIINGYTGDLNGTNRIWILNSSEWLATPPQPPPPGPATNSWTAASGKWETGGKWSLTAPPSLSDSIDLITNAGNNTVTIDSTTVSVPGILTISNLTVSANTLALSNTGTNVLRVLNSLDVFNSGAVTITSANLQSPGNGLVLDIDGGGSLSLNAGSLLVLTNGSIRVGENAGGAMAINGGTFSARDLTLGLSGGSSGTLTIAGGASQLRSTLTLGFAGGSTGTVWMTGGSMVASNATTTLGSSGGGSMTISNGSWLTTQMYVANANHSVGTLTLAGGSMTMSDNAFGVQPIVLVGGVVSGAAQATGTVWLTGGQMLFSNATVTVGDFGVGQMTISNGTFWANQMFVAVSSTAQGTVTFAGGNSQIFSTLDVGVFDNSTGTVWLTGGQLTVTNDRINVGLNGQGTMIMSNGTLLANEIVLGTNGTAAGTFTSYGGQVTITGPHTLIIGNTPGVNGRMAFVNGALDSHISPVLIGDAGTGSLDLSNSSAQALSVNLGARSGGLGSLTLRGPSTTLLISSNLTAGSVAGSTGMVTMTGGSMTLPNGILGIGNNGDPTQPGGFAQMTIANASVTANGVKLGSALGGHGVMTIKPGAILHIVGGCTACGLNYNEGILDGGTIDSPNAPFWAGQTHPGEFDVTNGTASFLSGYVGFDNPGTMSMVGGVVNVYSNLVIGDCGANVNGLVVMQGGSLYVTNGGSATLDIRDGTFFQTGGFVQIDRLMLSNVCGSLALHGGIFATVSGVFSNNSQFTVFSGATFNLLGGVQAFDTRLVVANNGTVSGCGTITGPVVVNAGGTVVAPCGTSLNFTGIVTNNGTIAALAGTTLNFYGAVYNNGVIDTRGGHVNFFGGETGPGSLLTGGTNSWIGGSAKWETAADWSVGAAPSLSDPADLITNAGNNTVTLDATTAGGFPATLTISNLTVSVNTLQLTNAGTMTPLHVLGPMTLVTGARTLVSNSVLQVDGDLQVGSTGSGNLLTITGGGQVTATNGYIGFANFASNSNNTALVTGPGSAWNLAFGLDLGVVSGGNQLIVSNGAVVSDFAAVVGDSPGAATNGVAIDNSVLVTGVSSLWSNTAFVILNHNDPGAVVTIANGGGFQAATVFLGTSGASSGNRMVVTDPGSSWTNSGLLNIGGFASFDLFIVSNGASAYSGSATIGANSGSGHAVLVDGTNSMWVCGGALNAGSFSSGNQIVVANGGQLFVTNSSGGASLYLGNANLAVAGGTALVSTIAIVGDCPGGAVAGVTINGGVLAVTNAAHNAVLDVRNGLVQVGTGGKLVVDILVVTNSCGKVQHFGNGTITAGTVVLDPTFDADSDGIPNGYEQVHGLDTFNPTDANADNDGDGFSNLQEYLAGTDPNDPNSVFRITSIIRTNSNLLVTWTMGSGKTNALQDANGVNYTTNFTDLFIVTNTVGTTTNYLDVGGATNIPSRYYRVRLVP